MVAIEQKMYKLKWEVLSAPICWTQKHIILCIGSPCLIDWPFLYFLLIFIKVLSILELFVELLVFKLPQKSKLKGWNLKLNLKLKGTKTVGGFKEVEDLFCGRCPLRSCCVNRSPDTVFSQQYQAKFLLLLVFLFSVEWQLLDQKNDPFEHRCVYGKFHFSFTSGCKCLFYINMHSLCVADSKFKMYENNKSTGENVNV